MAGKSLGRREKAVSRCMHRTFVAQYYCLNANSTVVNSKKVDIHCRYIWHKEKSQQNVFNSRTMSDCVSSSEKLSTLTWLGGWSLTPRGDLGSGGQGKEARRPQVQPSFLPIKGYRSSMFELNQFSFKSPQQTQAKMAVNWIHHITAMLLPFC